jgi:cytidine deaminase
MSEERKIEIKIRVFDTFQEIPTLWGMLLMKAREAASNSYSPYSNFEVGAAVLLDDGTIVPGSNQENAAYPTSLCAERVALFAAATQHPGKKIKALAVTARKAGASGFEAVSPCGSCRQVMTEYEDLHRQEYPIIMEGEKGGAVVFESAADLLPFRFSPENLKH